MSVEPAALPAPTGTEAHLTAKILARTAVVAVQGLGYVGLPLAVEKARVGYRVVGLDKDPERVAAVNAGQSHIPDVGSDVLGAVVGRGLLRASADPAVLGEADVIVICVPTPLTRNLTPDLRFVEQAARDIAVRLRPGQLVSLESTTYPGTTEELLLPILEGSGLLAERDFYLVHSPERMDPGNKRYTTSNTTKVIGGVGPASLRVGLAFYSQTVRHVVPVSSAKAAELVKVFENTFRAVNIALVNELALLCDAMGLSVWEVLDAAFTKPFGIMPFYPGPGVGGHCIPVDPHYLEWKARELGFNTHFIALAGEINRQMPEFVRRKALRVLNEMGLPPSDSRILVVGVTYKRDVPDCRESPALEVMKLLRQDLADVAYHDPLVPRLDACGLKLDSLPLTPENLGARDLVIITTDHSSVDYGLIVRHARRVLDTRNATRNVTERREIITLL
ncbi:MAG: nucleotide sugar dehydrogenase [Firmicutes bacterium]|nr:nucleotide sugar dehydrogenase [Bacillota bacterium]